MPKNNTTFTKSLDMLNIIGLRESIETLMTKESKYVPVANVCNTYLKKLNEGCYEEAICNDFYNELSKVAVHDSAKDALYALGQKLEESKRDINVVNRLHDMTAGSYSYVVPMIESKLVEYMSNKNADTRTAARQSLSLFEGIKEINDILESLSFDEYEEKTNKPLHNQSLNESMIPTPEKTYTQEEVDKMINEAASSTATEHEVKSLSSIDTHIYLDGTIKNIIKNTTNEGLKAFCEQYTNALNAGKAEELLYESFISGLSRWNFLSAVDTEASALKERISKYQQDIDLKKILKTMEGTGSYYIVPLIENAVVDYMDNKSMANKSILKQRLQAFEYDPFVRDILNVVMLDQSIANTVYLGESVEKLNSIVHTEKVFSPVQYVKENECIFNVKGTYYTRKGNTITKLAKSSINNLSESFKTLCNLVNYPGLKIDDLNNSITIYEGADKAVITESSIEINGTPLSENELNNIAERSHIANEHKEGFYKATQMINENFNKIAYIDFVKRLAMNGSIGKSVDVFRIKNNIFVNTVDESLGTSTFYRNVNPIQCRNYINEHMQINVAPLFEDILPNQHAILEGIEDTKKEYENYLDELNNKKDEFEKMKDSSDDTKDIDEAIKTIEDEIKEVQEKYDKFKKDSEEYVTGDEEDSTTEDPGAPAEDSVDETPAETEDQMQQPIDAQETDTMSDTDIDPMQSAIDSATPFDADFDVPAIGGDEKADIKVLRISYANNVKTHKKSNQGTAYVVIPSVDANGDIKDETKTVTFYLDADRKPIINNDYMPLMVYNAIVNAIAEDPDTTNIDVAGTAEQPSEEMPEIGTEPTLDGEPVDTQVDILATNTETTSAPVDDIPSNDVPAEPAPEDTEDMFGLDADPEASSVDAVDSEDALSEPISTDGIDDLGTDDEIPSGDYLDFDGTNGAAPATDNSNETTGTPITPAPEEAPAETISRSEDATYPIELGLNTNDIAPIKKESFCEACKNMCIECGEVEGESDSVTLKFANKAAVYALKDYFKEWKNFSDTEFISFFPELEKCFKNQPKVPVAPAKANESVRIISVNAINESSSDKAKNDTVTLVLPYSDDYAKLFEQKRAKGVSHIQIVTESFEETREVYDKLNTYAATVGDKLDEDAKMFLNKYAKDFSDIAEKDIYTLNVPFNGFLEQKLSAKGISVARVDENLSIAVSKDNAKKAKKIFESVYGKNAPIDVKNFFQLTENSLSEGVVITVEDTKTGKTVKIDTSDLDSDNSSEENDKDADPFKDVTTTFNASDSALFKSEDEDSDEGEEKEESTEETTDEQSEESTEEKEEKPEVKKTKFKFRKKSSSNESVSVDNTKQSLNESTNVCNTAKPNVLDWVTVGNSNVVGQIIGSLPMSGNFIVNCGFKTIEVSPKEVKLTNPKYDCVDAPFKYDPATLKGLFEQMVHCGMFINGNRVTPNNCYTKYSDFINANPDDDIRMVVESEQTYAKKKYIQITESINDFANVNDYAEGTMKSNNEQKQVLFNVTDYKHAEGYSAPVRTLVTDESGNKHLVNIPASYITPIEM